MEFRIQLDPQAAADEQRAIYNRIPLEFRDIYLAHLKPVLAEMVCTQTVEADRVLEAA